jgi:hypothetical protein
VDVFPRRENGDLVGAAVFVYRIVLNKFNFEMERSLGCPMKRWHENPLLRS